MQKKSGGMFSFILGAAAGAAALFLSKPENRVKAEKVVKKVANKAKKAGAEYKKNPEAFKRKVVTQAQSVAKKVVKKAKATKVVVKTKRPARAKSRKK